MWFIWSCLSRCPRTMKPRRRDTQGGRPSRSRPFQRPKRGDRGHLASSGASSLGRMTARRTIMLVRDGFPDPPTLDTAVSRAIVTRVARGDLPETLRLHRPGAIVAFGPKDRLERGFADAVCAAHERGFASIHRLAGGR